MTIERLQRPAARAGSYSRVLYWLQVSGLRPRWPRGAQDQDKHLEAAVKKEGKVIRHEAQKWTVSRKKESKIRCRMLRLLNKEKSCSVTVACPASLSFTVSQSLLKLMSIESMMPSNDLVLCCPLLFLPSIFPSITVFTNDFALQIRWQKYWSFSFSIRSSSEYSGLISFRVDRFNLLAVQGTLKSLLQHHSSKASILCHSAFFMVQLSHPYMTTGKTIALTIWTFVDKVMSLLFKMLSRLVIAFLPRSNHLLISWLQSPSAVILEPKKIKSVTVWDSDKYWWK